MLHLLLGHSIDDDAQGAPDRVAIKHVHDLLAGVKGANQDKFGESTVHFVKETTRGDTSSIRFKPPVGEKLHLAPSDEPGVMAWCDGCSHRHPLLVWEKRVPTCDGPPQGSWSLFFICTTSMRLHEVDG